MIGSVVADIGHSDMGVEMSKESCGNLICVVCREGRNLIGVVSREIAGDEVSDEAEVEVEVLTS